MAQGFAPTAVVGLTRGCGGEGVGVGEREALARGPGTVGVTVFGLADGEPAGVRRRPVAAGIGRIQSVAGFVVRGTGVSAGAGPAVGSRSVR